MDPQSIAIIVEAVIAALQQRGLIPPSGQAPQQQQNHQGQQQHNQQQQQEEQQQQQQPGSSQVASREDPQPSSSRYNMSSRFGNVCNNSSDDDYDDEDVQRRGRRSSLRTRSYAGHEVFDYRANLNRGVPMSGNGLNYSSPGTSRGTVAGQIPSRTFPRSSGSMGMGLGMGLQEDCVEAQLGRLYRSHQADEEERRLFSTSMTNGYAAVPSTSRGLPGGSQRGSLVMQAVTNLRNFQASTPSSSKRQKNNKDPKQTTWSLTVFFLGDPRENRIPDGGRKGLLERVAYLGPRWKIFAVDTTPATLYRGIFELFVEHTAGRYNSQINDPNFYLRFGHVSGSGHREITWFRHAVTTAELKHHKITTLYVQPSVILYPIMDEDSSDEDVQPPVRASAAASCNNGGAQSANYPWIRVPAGNSRATAIQPPPHSTPTASSVSTARPGSSVPPVSAVPPVPAAPPVPAVPPVPSAPSASSVVRLSSTIPVSSSSAHTRGAAPSSYNISRPSTSRVGFQPSNAVVAQPNLTRLQAFIFRTSAPTQTVRVPQLGNETPYIDELPRFLSEIYPQTRTRVHINGERTVDAGGPLRSYTWKVLIAVRNGTFNNVPIFDGPPGLATISGDRTLLQEGVMKMLGNFMIFATLNISHAMYGLNPKVVKYLLSSWQPEASELSVQDIPDADAQQMAMMLEQAAVSGEVPWSIDSEDAQSMTEFLAENDWFAEITPGNAGIALDHIKLHLFVGRRQASLDELRRVIQATEVGIWLVAHEESWADIFPPQYPKEPTVDDIMEAISGLNSADTTRDFLCVFLMDYVAAGKSLKDFVEAVTGSPYLEGARIRVVLDNNADTFTSSTCSNELRIRPTEIYDEFAEKINIFIENAKWGFTDI